MYVYTHIYIYIYIYIYIKIQVCGNKRALTKATKCNWLCTTNDARLQATNERTLNSHNKKLFACLLLEQ